MARDSVSLSVVVPVYNERAILAETVSSIVARLRGEDGIGSLQVVVAENGSSDGTRALGRRLAQRYEEVLLLESDVADYGAAMRRGFETAGGEFIVNFDADYYDFGFIRRALELDADVVVAAKGIDGSDDTRTLLRRVVSRSFSLVVQHLLDLRTTETHGMKVFRRAAIEPILPRVQATQDLFDTELLARCERSGLTIEEVPITTEEMRHSRSGILRRIPRTLWGLADLRRRLRGEYRASRDPVGASPE